MTRPSRFLDSAQCEYLKFPPSRLRSSTRIGRLTSFSNRTGRDDMTYVRDLSHYGRWFLMPEQAIAEISGAELIDEGPGVPSGLIIHPQLSVTSDTPEPESEQSKARKLAKIPRPPNAYILYRKDRHHNVKSAHPGIHNNEICKSRWPLMFASQLKSLQLSSSESCGEPRRGRSARHTLSWLPRLELNSMLNTPNTGTLPVVLGKSSGVRSVARRGALGPMLSPDRFLEIMSLAAPSLLVTLDTRSCVTSTLTAPSPDPTRMTP
jgi:hypothetical protein